MAEWITDSQDEQSLEELFRDTDQVHIPVFQRSYVWKQKQFDELTEDIRLVRDGIEDSQFLGAVVAYERPRQHEIVGRLRAIAIVDGQQRILTLYIFVMAITETMARLDPEGAAEVVREFLLLPQRRGLEINTRVVPAYDDRSQFRILWDRLNSTDVLHTYLETNPPSLPPPSGESAGDLTKQYRRLDRYIRKGMPDDPEEGLTYLTDLLDIVTRKLTFVHLKLTDASAATKIFERLNFRGVKVNIVDLVRNEVFSRVADDPGEAKHLFDTLWQPFESAFLGRSEPFFFPYCLIQDSNTTKSELFSQLRETWNDLDPQAIIDHMVPYQKPFLAIDTIGGMEGYPAVSEALDRLVRLRRPAAVYPFVMQLLHTLDQHSLSEEDCASILHALESFLIRRAIVGFEPTGLHALFKGLWNELNDITPEGFAAVVASKPTIQWPTDEEVRQAIQKRPLAKAKICNYLLVEYDSSLPGDHVSVPPTIEHILPQKYEADGPWAQAFTREEHKELLHTLANVIPLSSPLNSSLQMSAYDIKKDRYLQESMFVTARQVSQRWDTWAPEALAQRTDVLGDWAVERWPYGPYSGS